MKNSAGILLLFTWISVASLSGSTLVYSVTGTISNRILLGVDPLPGVDVGAELNLVLTITTGVVGMPGYVGLPWPRSMTYPMPTPPDLLEGTIGAVAVLGIDSSASVMLADVPAPGAPQPIADRLQIFGLGSWSNEGTTSGGTVQLVLTDPQGAALSSPDLPSGPITGFPEAQFIVQNPFRNTGGSYGFVPTITLIPEPMTGMLAASGCMALLRRRRKSV